MQKITGFSPQIDHEIQWNVRGESVDELVWQVGQYRCNSLAGWSVERIASMLFDNRSLSV